ncbi:helix-turn-helix domain-containing protein [Desulfoscipio gibsoniae]|uniref:Putative transcriptional regulator n=1 Tax=Desulfoscipio gibsoniae DSM 7213 TaxID=767817 RepID=R4KM52_9FIRM|nr:helix-turn-helix transcriptional regulator [Desulfoscipio gibsoniae]AGL01600.1 putative transcriptional regulator [Desulfoscipio gibsoniae DSM 7213]
MIKFKLDRLLFEKGNMKIPKLQEMSGVNKNTLYAIYKGSITRVDVSVIDRICSALNVQPGDLMEYVKEESADAAQVQSYPFLG